MVKGKKYLKCPFNEMGCSSCPQALKYHHPRKKTIEYSENHTWVEEGNPWTRASFCLLK